MVAEKLQESAILLALTNAGGNDFRISRRIYVHRVVAVRGILSRARKLLENVAAPLKNNGFVLHPVKYQIFNISGEKFRCEKCRNQDIRRLSANR